MNVSTRVVVVSLLTSVGALAQSEPLNIIEGFTPPAIEPGSPAGSFALSGFETVNPYSGKLGFGLPLLQIGGRGEAGYTMTLAINQEWIVDIVDYTCPSGPPDICFAEVPRHNWWTTRKPGYSPGVLHSRTAQELVACGDSINSPTVRDFLTRLTFTTADGTEIQLRDVATNGQIQQKSEFVTCESAFSNPFNRGTVFKSFDGSAITFVSDTDITDLWNPNNPNNIRHPSGNLHFPSGVMYRIEDGLVKRIRDRNGNEVVLSYNGTNQLILIEDSLDRQITIAYGNPDIITYTGAGAASRTIKVTRVALSTLAPSRWIACDSANNFPVPCDTSNVLFPEAEADSAFLSQFDTSVTRSVELPNGKLYTFGYNEYAELTQILLPTGGKIEYSYLSGSPTTTSGYFQDQNKVILRRVGERRLYPDGSNLEQRTVYGHTISGTGLGTTTVNVEHRNSGGTLLAEERHTHSGRPTSSAFGTVTPTSYPSWKEGRRSKSERLSTAGTALRTTDEVWNQRSGEPGENMWWVGTLGLEGDFAPASDPRLTESTETFNPTGLVRKQKFTYDCGFRSKPITIPG